jgi:NADPH:quinone reductase-like Zn-dependent oxidoreductase
MDIVLAKEVVDRRNGGVMTAARVHAAGPPGVISIESIPVPEPGEGEMLVRVAAAGVGPWDALVRTGKSGLPHTYPLTLGSEISGRVEKVGPGIVTFARGDAVFGATNPSFIDGYAEYAIAKVRMIAKKPASLSDLQGAAMPVVAVTAWQMLFDHAKAQAGQTVVVHGGAGNLGAYAVQLAHSRKLTVIATVHGTDSDYVRALGADEVLDTKSEDIARLGRRADVVIDTVGGKDQDRLFGVLKPGGIVVSSVVRPNVELAKTYGVTSDYLIVDVNGEDLAQLAAMHERGELVIPVGSVLPLQQAQIAHEMLAGKPHKRGKIVLEVR